MALTNVPVYPQTPKLGVVQFLQGTDSTGTYKTFYTGGTNGSKIGSLMAVSNDSSNAHQIIVQVSRSSIQYGGFSISVPFGSGYQSTATPVDVLRNWVGLPTDSDGNPFLYLQASDLLQITFQTALSTAAIAPSTVASINVYGTIADY